MALDPELEPNKTNKEYLGDAVYARFDTFGLWLTTEDGCRATNSIFFEPSVWKALKAYVDRHEKRKEEPCQDPQPQ